MKFVSTFLLFIIQAVRGVIASIGSNHPRLVRLADDQLRGDFANEQYAPDPSTMTEMTPIGNFTLKTLIHAGAYSAVFTVNETRRFLIKYQCDCEDTADLHPLLRDAWFSRIAHELGIAPEIFFVSPPLTLPTIDSTKFQFRMKDDERQECHSNGGTVRFMIMERIHGESLLIRKHRNAHAPIPINQSVAITHTVLTHLFTLHQNGIVHGDIHAGNVLIAPNPNRSGRIYLIDFGSAFFYDPNKPNYPVFPFGLWLHELTSPWQIEGYPWGKRDDVYKTMDMLARLINGPEFVRFIRDLKNSGSPHPLLGWRLTECLFEFPPGTPHSGPFPFDPATLGVDWETAKQVREWFWRMSDLALAVNDVNEEPLTQRIMDILFRIHLATTLGIGPPSPPRPIDAS